MENSALLLDYREPEWVAEKLGLDKNTVYKYLQEGWLPGVQLGRKWLISERLLAEYLERQTRTQTEMRRKELPMTPRLKRAIELAVDYAKKRGQDFVGTEHLLIGMILEGPDNVGTRVLVALGLDLAKPQKVFEELAPAETKKVKEAVLTDRAQSALKVAQEQAIGMGHEYVGCESLLLGLLLETSGMAFQILEGLGVTYERARQEVVRLVQGRA